MAESSGESAGLLPRQEMTGVVRAYGVGFYHLTATGSVVQKVVRGCEKIKFAYG